MLTILSLSLVIFVIVEFRYLIIPIPINAILVTSANFPSFTASFLL